MNQTIFQFFHWYFSAEDNLWNSCAEEAATLAALGVTDLWLPPAYKSAKGISEPGYAVYDLYDLGEFNQKGTIRTKHGTKQQYINCVNELHKHGIRIVADIVLNHKMGGDETEQIPVVEVSEEDRNHSLSQQLMVEADTKFTFPGRNGAYSTFTWDWHCFTGVLKDKNIYRIQNEYGTAGWEPLPNRQKGNYDFLLANDIEFRNPAVVDELKNWGEWYVKTTGIDGFRLDGLKHITTEFYPAWLQHLDTVFSKHHWAIGEYWANDIAALLKYIEITGGRIKLVDVPLHFKMNEASVKKEKFDLRTLFEGTLASEKPDLAITFVDNHDTQPLQSLESTIEPWFQPLAYALILLRKEGTPCVFYPALYGAEYEEQNKNDQKEFVRLEPVPLLKEMLHLRKNYKFGTQTDYFDDPNLVGWTCNEQSTGWAVVISNRHEGSKIMSMGFLNAGRMMYELGNTHHTITLDEKGVASFNVKAMSISVWVLPHNQGKR